MALNFGVFDLRKEEREVEEGRWTFGHFAELG